MLHTFNSASSSDFDRISNLMPSKRMKTLERARTQNVDQISPPLPAICQSDSSSGENCQDIIKNKVTTLNDKETLSESGMMNEATAKDGNCSDIDGFDVSTMRTFEDIYNYINANSENIDESVKLEIKQFVENESLNLKSFEKMLLIQKISET